ncbi:MAG TPA: antitoxin [Streptomyces sp.]|jgi:Arc/MetJ-type ribon-helix-helix transcriptional regulator|nr:antitoxin [Streptomyces sp.]
MKISVSLPPDDVAFVDEYVQEQTVESRSAVIHAAIEMLRSSRLEEDYAAAWEEWASADDAELWDGVTGDGIAGASR